jgi:hypothetical protein
MEEPDTIGDRLYARFEEAIMDGRLWSGQRVNADELAEHYGVGGLDAICRRDRNRATEIYARAHRADAGSGSSSNAGQTGSNEVAGWLLY